MFTASALQKDVSTSSSVALLCEDLQASLSSSLATSSTTPVRHHHHYYCQPQTAHERLSVLCSSLDELSSRDEMFSTDLGDVDVFPGCSVYARGRFSDDLGEAEVKEVCPQSKKLMCVCCGSSLLKGGVSSRVKVHHSPRVYAAGDSDEVVEQEQRGCVRTCERAHPSRVVVKKHPVHKKHQPLPLHIRHAPKHSCKRGQWREAIGSEEQEPETVLVGSELKYYEGHVVEGESGHGTGDKQHGTCKGHFHCFASKMASYFLTDALNHTFALSYCRCRWTVPRRR